MVDREPKLDFVFFEIYLEHKVKEVFDAVSLMADPTDVVSAWAEGCAIALELPCPQPQLPRMETTAGREGNKNVNICRSFCNVVRVHSWTMELESFGI